MSDTIVLELAEQYGRVMANDINNKCGVYHALHELFESLFGRVDTGKHSVQINLMDYTKVNDSTRLTFAEDLKPRVYHNVSDVDAAAKEYAELARTDEVFHARALRMFADFFGLYAAERIGVHIKLDSLSNQDATAGGIPFRVLALLGDNGTRKAGWIQLSK